MRLRPLPPVRPLFVVSVMSPLGPSIAADCIYIQWQEKVNVAVINSCISISGAAPQ